MEILACPDFDPELAKDVVLKALISKVDTESMSSSNFTMTERAYRHPPVKIVEFESPC